MKLTTSKLLIFNYFVDRFGLVDNGYEKGFTFYKGTNPCMRIDFCLTKGVDVKDYKLKKTGLSDHVMMAVLV